MTANRFETESFPRLLTEGLWVLGNYYFNLYLVKGEQASALIEVGVSAIVDDVIKQLDALQVRPTFLVVTHPHADHITGLPALKEKFPQALVVAAEGAPEFLAHPKAGESIEPEDRHITNFLEAHGIRSGRPPVTEPPTLENCLIARDNDEMDLGGLTLRFLGVKGHAPGEIVVWIPQMKTLVLSDSIGFRFPGRGVMPLFFTGYSDYMATIDRLEALEPSIIGVAHQGPIVGRKEIKTSFREVRQTAEDLRDLILSNQRDADDLVRDIFERYYRDELTMYTEENIINCARLLVKRAKESPA
jgi:glyoxylase-like metal-dependent hydrolase (beta-lactamase superfamily II)